MVNKMRAGLLLAAAGLMLFAACGDDDDLGDVDDVEPTEEISTPAVAAEPTPTPEDAETATPATDTDVVEPPPVSGEGTVPEGWEVVTDADGLCQMAVPEDWEEILAGSRSSPQYNAHAYFAVEEISDWDEHKGRLRSMLMGGHVVVEDSDDLLYLQSGADSGDTSFMIARPVDGHACSVLVATASTFYGDHDDVFAGILESLAPVD
ncbi:MAG TPA: hypothetical protein VMM78_08935 [Thermomicrobiales bacterium]|nr:hypothetical protein [Thermomicrobiales bacterium]